jgi:hypothetical protein
VAEAPGPGIFEKADERAEHNCSSSSYFSVAPNDGGPVSILIFTYVPVKHHYVVYRATEELTLNRYQINPMNATYTPHNLHAFPTSALTSITTLPLALPLFILVIASFPSSNENL